MKQVYAALAAGVLSVIGVLNVFNGFGGAYLGFAVWLILAVRREKLIEAAALSVVAVMSGLAAGRIVSLASGGETGPRFWVSAGVELGFAVWGLFLLRTSADR
ncbi:MAG: DUF4345 family protein [Treponemataceae bacterium]